MDCIKNRTKWVDIAKGFVILSVVAGHTIKYGNTGLVIRNIFYSFHMPFFFIMSGYTAKLSDSMEELKIKTKKLFYSLIIPMLTAFIFRTIWYTIVERPEINMDFFFNKLYTLLFLFSDNAKYQTYTISEIGYIWFLPTLFLCRTLFNYLNLVLDKILIPFVICLLSILGYVLSIQQHLFLFSFDIVLTILPFLFCGNCLKTLNFFKTPLHHTIYTLLFWSICFFIQNSLTSEALYLDIIRRVYPMYPFCFITAIMGTLFVCYISVLFSHIYISNFIAFIGKHSIVFLIVHYFDYIWQPLWKAPHDQYIRFFSRALLDLVVFLAVLAIISIIKKAKRSS